MDTLNLRDKKSMVKSLLKDGTKFFIRFDSKETILWSGFITKINKRKRSQRRKFCLTNIRFINFGDKKLKNILIGFFAGSMVKRQIDIIKITHLTYSETSNEFVLHVPSEYDYRLTTLDKDSFIYFLLMIRENLA